MSTDLYWKIRQPAKNLLPTAIKWAWEESHVINVSFLRGYLVNCPDDEKEGIELLIKALNDDVDVEFEVL